LEYREKDHFALEFGLFFCVHNRYPEHSVLNSGFTSQPLVHVCLQKIDPSLHFFSSPPLKLVRVNMPIPSGPIVDAIQDTIRSHNAARVLGQSDDI